MEFRRARKSDYEAIYHLVEEAFKTAKVADGTEQEFVLRLRESPNYLPELEFVVEDQGQLVAHVLLSKQELQQPDSVYTGVLVAPLCVAFDFRNQKIGADLLRYSFEEAKKSGYQAAFLVGDPIYYCQFGFRPVTDFGIANKNPIPDDFVLACELVPDALQDVKGDLVVVS